MKVLYLEGDRCSPKYLTGALRSAGIKVVEDAADGLDGMDAVLLSDMPRKRLGILEKRLARRVSEGQLGLAMVGGWTSFGRGGYAGSPIEDLLPVRMQAGDDRRNVHGGLWLQRANSHPITSRLPFARPPVITGYNDLRGKRGSQRVLHAVPLRPSLEGARFGPRIGIMWLRDDGLRSLALATDLAPHWSGGLTDWGSQRVAVGEGEELGDAYVRFIANLMRWTAGEPLAAAPRRATKDSRNGRRKPGGAA